MDFQVELKFSSFALSFILKTKQNKKNPFRTEDGSVGKALATKVWGPQTAG